MYKTRRFKALNGAEGMYSFMMIMESRLIVALSK